MSIVHTPLFASSLITVPSRNVSNVRILFIQHDNVSGSDNLLHRSKSFDNTRSPECYAPLNSPVCLEWNVLFTQVSDCSSFAATNFFGDVLRSSLTRGNIA